MSDPDTTIGGTRRVFPTTIWSDILAAGDPSDPRSRDRLDRLLRTYWKPVFAYVRSSWRKSVEDAKDLTQAFFTSVLQKDYLSRLDPDRGSFRGYLKKALKHFLIDAERSDAVRRPVDPVFRLDADPAELERISPAAGESPERAYDREWFRALLSGAIEAMRGELESEGKAVYFEVFRIYCLDPQEGSSVQGGEPTYQEVAVRLEIQESDVRNFLSFCRSVLRQILRERIRDYVAGDDEVDRELEEVLKG